MAIKSFTEIKCEICQKRFSRENSEIKRNKHCYCSQLCSQKGRRFFGVKKYKEYSCSICQKVFKRYESQVLSRGITFAYCSKKCNGVARSQKYIGEKHPQWKGDNVGYHGLHKWVKKVLGKPLQCKHCLSNTNLEWANKSRQYARILEDWIPLCKSCHNKYDNITNRGWITRRLNTEEGG